METAWDCSEVTDLTSYIISRWNKYGWKVWSNSSRLKTTSYSFKTLIKTCSVENKFVWTGIQKRSSTMFSKWENLNCNECMNWKYEWIHSFTKFGRSTGTLVWYGKYVSLYHSTCSRINLLVNIFHTILYNFILSIT